MKRRTRKTSRRNPATATNLLPLALVAGGAYLLLRKQAAPAPVNGMGDLAWGGSFVESITGAVSDAAGAVKKVVQKASTTTLAVASQVMSSPLKAAVLVAALPVTALVTGGAAVLAATKLQGKQDEPAQQAPVTQYQDADGNPITEAEYNRQMAILNAPAPATPPPPVYQDANGNVITQDQYNQLLAQLAAQAKTQGTTAPQPTVVPATSAATPTVMKLPPMPPVTQIVATPTTNTPAPSSTGPYYFDATGASITAAQFNTLMTSLQSRFPSAGTIMPTTSNTASGTVYMVPTDQQAAAQAAQNGPVVTQSAGSGQANPVTYQPSGGSSSSDYSLPPAYTAPTQQAAAPSYDASAATAPAATPGKLNPLAIGATFAAVPLVFMLMGNK